MLLQAVTSCYSRYLGALRYFLGFILTYILILVTMLLNFQRMELKMETYTRKQVAEMLKVTQAYLASKKMRDVLPFYKDPTNGFITYEKKIVDDYIEAKIEAVKARYFS
jgi:hypothetical protein